MRNQKRTKQHVIASERSERSNLSLRLLRRLRLLAMTGIIALLLWLVQGVCLGAEYYLDAVNGNGSNPGTSNAPWKTVATALTVVSSGDTVIMANGTYDAFIDATPNRSDWLTFQAADGAKPELPYIEIGSTGWNKNAYLRLIGIRVISNEAKTGGNRILYVKDAPYVEIKDCYLYGYKRYLSIGVLLEANNVTIDHCEVFYDLDSSENFPTVYDASYLPGKTRGIECAGQNISIINNYIHDMASSGIYITQPSTVLIQNNHLANQRLVWPGPSEGQITNSVHGSGISLMSSNVTIRQNIIRGFGRSKVIGIYGASGAWNGIANNLVIENNLMYDISPSLAIATNNGQWGSGCKFNHNTIICRYKQALPAEEHYERYMTAISIPDGFEFYNNLIVGRVANTVAGTASWVISTSYSVDNTVNSDYHGYICIQAHTSTNDDRPGFGANWQTYWQLMPGRVVDCGGNIVFSYLYPYSHSHHHGWDTMANSTILCSYVSGHLYGWKGVGWNPETDFFIADSAEEMLLPIPPSGLYYTTADFRPKSTAPYINYGDVTKAIATGKSLGTLGPDGFISDDGVMRDQNHHSAGCYEYVKLQSPDQSEDKSEDKTEIKCYNNVINPTKEQEALIWVELSKQAHVKISLYNTRGNRIRRLADKEEDAGTCRYYWDGKDDSENIVGSGLYFVHIQAGDYKKTKKIVVVK